MTMKQKPKTYSESKDKKFFDWNKFLNKKKYTLEQLGDARNLSESWVTCACGNQCSVLTEIMLELQEMKS